MTRDAIRVEGIWKNRASRALLAASAVLLCVPVLAQNYVRNPDFEQPLTTNDWTVVFVGSGPSDFSIHDRTTIAHKDKVPGTWDGEPNYLDVYGAEFSPYHDALIHAYFKQTVMGLKPWSNYVVSCWMTQFEALYTNKVQVYMEAAGGAGNTVVARTPNVYAACNNKPTAWAMYSVTNSANGSGQLEVRLHFNKDKWTTLAWQYIRAYYDHVAVMVPGQMPPPFKMVSAQANSGATFTLKWETTMNNTYDVQSRSGFGLWATLQSDLLAIGTNLTFTTDMTLAPRVPQLFRAVSHNYVP